MAVVASLLLGGAILALIQPAFAEKSDTITLDPSGGENEASKMISISLNEKYSNFNVEFANYTLICPAIQFNHQFGTQQGENNNFHQEVRNFIDRHCLPPTNGR
jgi:hypothetical protein